MIHHAGKGSASSTNTDINIVNNLPVAIRGEIKQGNIGNMGSHQYAGSKATGGKAGGGLNFNLAAGGLPVLLQNLHSAYNENVFIVDGRQVM